MMMMMVLMIFTNMDYSVKPVGCIFSCWLILTGDYALPLCFSSCPETCCAGNTVSGMVFCLFRLIPVYLTDTIFLVVAARIHTSEGVACNSLLHAFLKCSFMCASNVSYMYVL